MEKSDEGDFSGAYADYTKAIEFNPSYYLPFIRRGMLSIYELADYSSGCKDMSIAFYLTILDIGRAEERKDEARLEVLNATAGVALKILAWCDDNDLLSLPPDY